MIVLRISALTQIEADKKDAVWYDLFSGTTRVRRAVVDNHVVGYNFDTFVVSEEEFLAEFPQAKKVPQMSSEVTIN